MGELLSWRPDKGSHLETIYYEIRMWQLCFQRLTENQKRWIDIWDSYVYLEGFLLHYRGLVEFFSGRHHRKGVDLSFEEPEIWAGRRLSESEVKDMREPAAALEERGDWKDISQYLQHCTVRRFKEPKSWPTSRMFRELNEIVVRFEQSFPLG